VLPVPPLMHYQGHLTNPEGFPPPEGIYSLRFSLWDAPSAGTQLWNQTFPAVQVQNGSYQVLFSGLSADLFNGNLWLEVQVGEEPPLSVRQPVTSVAYAFKADSVAEGAITSASLLNGSITAEKLADELRGPLEQVLGAAGLSWATEAVSV